MVEELSGSDLSHRQGYEVVEFAHEERPEMLPSAVRYDTASRQSFDTQTVTVEPRCSVALAHRMS